MGVLCTNPGWEQKLGFGSTPPPPDQLPKMSAPVGDRAATQTDGCHPVFQHFFSPTVFNPLACLSVEGTEGLFLAASPAPLPLTIVRGKTDIMNIGAQVVAAKLQE